MYIRQTVSWQCPSRHYNVLTISSCLACALSCVLGNVSDKDIKSLTLGNSKFGQTYFKTLASIITTSSHHWIHLSSKKTSRHIQNNIIHFLYVWFLQWTLGQEVFHHSFHVTEIKKLNVHCFSFNKLHFIFALSCQHLHIRLADKCSNKNYQNVQSVWKVETQQNSQQHQTINKTSKETAEMYNICNNIIIYMFTYCTVTGYLSEIDKNLLSRVSGVAFNDFDTVVWMIGMTLCKTGSKLIK